MCHIGWPNFVRQIWKLFWIVLQRICDLHLIKRQQISSGITPYSQDFGTKMECLISSLKKESGIFFYEQALKIEFKWLPK